jgi:hypothetical protein
MDVRNRVPTLGTVQISRPPPTYRVRRGEGRIQGGEGRITTQVTSRPGCGLALKLRMFFPWPLISYSTVLDTVI